MTSSLDSEAVARWRPEATGWGTAAARRPRTHGAAGSAPPEARGCVAPAAAPPLVPGAIWPLLPRLVHCLPCGQPQCWAGRWAVCHWGPELGMWSWAMTLPPGAPLGLSILLVLPDRF